MSFAATAPAATSEALPNGAFWPRIEPDDFRDVMRVDGTVSAPRLKHALINAIVSVNDELRRWRRVWEAQGLLRLSDVPDEEGPYRRLHLYLRAVYEMASADLLERMLRFDATGDAQQRAEQQQETIHDHRRNAIWAMRDLQGLPRATVELI